MSRYRIDLEIESGLFSAEVYRDFDYADRVSVHEDFNTLGALMHAVVRSIYEVEARSGQQDADR